MHGLFLLGSALAALAVGPLLLSRLENRRLLALVDGFVMGSIVALVVARVLPDALGRGGAWAVLAAAVGSALPRLLESRPSARLAERGTLVIAVVGLSVHAMLDGAALTASSDPGLTVAVLLHRVPSGLFVFWMIRPRQLAYVVLVLDALATTLGFFVGDRVEIFHGPFAAYMSALIAGSLLHVVVAHGPQGSAGDRLPSSAGFLFGVGLLLLVPEGHEHGMMQPWSEALVRAGPSALGGLLLDLLLLRTPVPRGLGVVAAVSAFELGLGAATWLVPAMVVVALRRAWSENAKSGLELVPPAGLMLLAAGLASQATSPVVPSLAILGAAVGMISPMPLVATGAIAVLLPSPAAISLLASFFARRLAFVSPESREVVPVRVVLGGVAAAACGWIGSSAAMMNVGVRADELGWVSLGVMSLAVIAAVLTFGPRQTVIVALGLEQSGSSAALDGNAGPTSSTS
ncbi:MAG: hypothetical protein HY791_00750 [Deltaproteobacteria bacterium]|nr:hypothetical protein [Deltaproteobacteria bacterium]